MMLTFWPALSALVWSGCVRWETATRNTISLPECKGMYYAAQLGIAKWTPRPHVSSLVTQLHISIHQIVGCVECEKKPVQSCTSANSFNAVDISDIVPFISFSSSVKFAITVLLSQPLIRLPPCIPQNISFFAFLSTILGTNSFHNEDASHLNMYEVIGMDLLWIFVGDKGAGGKPVSLPCAHFKKIRINEATDLFLFRDRHNNNISCQ